MGQVVNELLAWLCLHAQLCFTYSTVFIATHMFTSLFVRLILSPIPLAEE